MASYRFCRSDDLPLLARAHETCVRPFLPGEPGCGPDELKRAAREIDLWTSGCMLAAEGPEPLGVVFSAKRETEACILSVGVRPDRRREGHGRHLLASLRAKLAILGPPRIVAEVPAELEAACAFFADCGFRAEAELVDFVARTPAETRGAEIVTPVSVADLQAAGAFDPALRRPWSRTIAVLARRAAALRGLALAAGERIEAWLLYESDPAAAERRVVALDCGAGERQELWLRLLLQRLGAGDRRPVRLSRASEEEVPFAVLGRCGFVAAERTIVYAAAASGA